MGEIPEGHMNAAMGVILAILSVAMLFASDAGASSKDEMVAQRIVDRAQATLDDFIREPKKVRLRTNLDHAKGVMIFPEVLQGGLILGGSGGNGVILVRDEKTGNWSYPAFLAIKSISLGLQIGGEASSVVMLAMNPEAIDSLFFTSYTMGGSSSISLGVKGVGVERSRYLPDLVGKFISFAKPKGFYAGLTLTGSMIYERNGLETAYYGKQVTLADIILMNMASNKGADGLLETLKRVGAQ